MDDVKEIQQQELEALESIYVTELNIFCGEYPNISIAIEILPDCLPSLKSNEPIEGLVLIATLPADYPNVSPIIKCEGKEDDEYFSKLLKQAEKELIKVAEENLGMSMIFTLVAAFQDFITQEVTNLSANVEKIEREKKAIADRLEQVHFEGSRVTLEQFNEWKEKFMKELKIKKESELKEKELIVGRLTGKQLFLRDDSLNLSDLQFNNSTDQAAADIEIDATLFEGDIDDGDLSDASI